MNESRVGGKPKIVVDANVRFDDKKEIDSCDE
jgi:hypothetical protein